MRKIIDHKAYDTDTSHEVGEWWNGRGRNDFDFLMETLYRKTTGEYFLLGEGGARTEYCEWIGDSVYNGERVIPMTYERARDWAERRLSADEYMAEFGDPGEGDGDGNVKYSINIPTALKARLERAAARRGVRQNQLILEFIEGLED